MGMMDNINFSMRDDILKFATSGTDRNWKMRQEKEVPVILPAGKKCSG